MNRNVSYIIIWIPIKFANGGLLQIFMGLYTENNSVVQSEQAGKSICIFASDLHWNVTFVSNTAIHIFYLPIYSLLIGK